MNTRIIIAVILIALGVVSFAYQGIQYTTKEKVMNLGPIEATKKETKTIPLPPIVGAVLLVGGVAVLLTSRKGD